MVPWYGLGQQPGRPPPVPLSLSPLRLGFACGSIGHMIAPRRLAGLSSPGFGFGFGHPGVPSVTAPPSASMDAAGDVYAEWLRTHPHARPLSFVLALQDGTRLRLRTHAGVWHIVTLQAGDILLFDGGVWHNGLGYPTGNDRVHGYLRPAGYNAGSRAVSHLLRQRPVTHSRHGRPEPGGAHCTRADQTGRVRPSGAAAHYPGGVCPGWRVSVSNGVACTGALARVERPPKLRLLFITPCTCAPRRKRTRLINKSRFASTRHYMARQASKARHANDSLEAQHRFAAGWPPDHDENDPCLCDNRELKCTRICSTERLAATSCCSRNHS